MNFLMDTANLDSIRYGVEYFPVIGVTTNPTLITREEVPDPAAHIAAIREIIGPDRQLHVQLTETEEEQMLAEAEAIVALTGKNTYLKVPVSPLGLRVTRALSEQGYGVTETAILSVGQAVLASRAGAGAVAADVCRPDNINGRGPTWSRRLRKSLIRLISGPRSWPPPSKPCSRLWTWDWPAVRMPRSTPTCCVSWSRTR